MDGHGKVGPQSHQDLVVSLAQPSKDADNLFDAVAKLVQGQQQLSEKVDLQLRQLDQILKWQEQTGIQQPVELEDVARQNSLGYQIDITPSDDASPGGGKAASPTFMPMLSRTVNSFDGETYQQKTDSLVAYQNAMGWRKQMESLFKVDPQADWLTRFASGPVWTFFCMFLIVVNAIVIGVETHLTTVAAMTACKSGHGQETASSSLYTDVFKALEIVFLVWMVFEVLVNAYAQKRNFLCGKDWPWNAFDVFMVVAAVVMDFSEMVSVSFLRVVRLFRLGKILRAFRVIKFLRSVRSMMISISGSLMHLSSALFVMCIFMYVVALIIMQMVAVDVYTVAGEHDSGTRSLAISFDQSKELTGVEELDALYGSISSTFMTLFLTVSGGLEWSQAAGPVAKLGFSYGLIWIGYIAFMVFGMMNVLTGIFVETAMDAMNNDRDNMIQSQIEERESLISTISNVFRSTDTDGSGMLSEEEMEVLLQDAELRAYLEAIGIDSTEAKGFFQLLDDDSSGTVSIDEFVTGFLRLKGGAKAVDMVSLMYENRKISKKLTKICEETRSLRKAFACLQENVRPPVVVVSPRHLGGRQNNESSRKNDHETSEPGRQLMENIAAFGIHDFSLASRIFDGVVDAPDRCRDA